EVPYAELGALEVIRDNMIRVEGGFELINQTIDVPARCSARRRSVFWVVPTTIRPSTRWQLKAQINSRSCSSSSCELPVKTSTPRLRAIDSTSLDRGAESALAASRRTRPMVALLLSVRLRLLACKLCL